MADRPDFTGIGARIKKRRLELGLTQSQVGEPDFTSAYISLIECGHRRPSPDTLAVIARRLQVAPDELLSDRPPGLEARLELELHEARGHMDDGDLKRADSIAERVLDEARSFAMNRVEARAEEARATLAERRGDLATALDHFRKASELWEGEPIYLRVDTVTGLARCTRRLGNPRMAIHVLDSFERELTGSQHPHPTALMRTYNEMIYAYFAIGVPEKASEAAESALRLEPQVDDPKDIACMYITVARSLMFERSFSDALNCVRRAADIYSGGGWRDKTAKAHVAEGIVLSKKGDYEAAQERLESGLALLEGSPNSFDTVLALNELGRVWRNLGDPELALDYLRRAATRLHPADTGERAFNARETGLSLQFADPQSAESHLKKALDLYRIAGIPNELATTCKALGDFYMSQGQPDRAFDALREGLDYVEERSG